jgi:ABC-2 type transport system permease protein
VEAPLEKDIPAAEWGLGYYLNAYRALFKVGLAMMLQYRFAVLIWAVWGFVGPLVSLAVWTAVASGRAVSNGATGATFERGDFVAYFLTFMIFGHLSMSWDAFEFGFRVRTGQLSPQLLLPIHPMHGDAARNAGFKIVTSAMLFPVWIALIWILKPTPPQSMMQLALSLPALLLAAVVRYVWQYSLATLAFWTTRVEAVNQLWFTLDSFLAGRVAPLALMPGALAAVAYFSPFRSMGAFPVELALGRIPPEQIVPGFALQLAWLGFGVVALRLLWAAGIKKYSAVGA